MAPLPPLAGSPLDDSRVVLAEGPFWDSPSCALLVITALNGSVPLAVKGAPGDGGSLLPGIIMPPLNPWLLSGGGVDTLR